MRTKALTVFVATIMLATLGGPGSTPWTEFFKTDPPNPGGAGDEDRG